MPGVDVIFILGFVVAVLLIGAVVALRFYGQRITRFLPLRFAELGAASTRAAPGR